MIETTNLWALTPNLIPEVVKGSAIENILPDGLKAILGGQKAAKQNDPIRQGGTAIVNISGVLSPKGSSGTSTERLAAQMRDLAADKKIGAIILNVESPGGFVYGTPEAADAIYEARKSKPVVAVATTMAASAAYWLASQSSAFYASPSADVGSVGVYASHTDTSGFEDKIGFKTTLVSAGPKKVLGNPYEALTEEAQAEIQESVDESYQSFLNAIARGRGISAKDVASGHGEGALVSAHKAQGKGMIDGVMTLQEVVSKYSSSRSRLSLMRRQAAARRCLANV